MHAETPASHRNAHWSPILRARYCTRTYARAHTHMHMHTCIHTSTCTHARAHTRARTFCQIYAAGRDPAEKGWPKVSAFLDERLKCGPEHEKHGCKEEDITRFRESTAIEYVNNADAGSTLLHSLSHSLLHTLGSVLLQSVFGIVFTLFSHSVLHLPCASYYSCSFHSDQYSTGMWLLTIVALFTLINIQQVCGFLLLLLCSL